MTPTATRGAARPLPGSRAGLTLLEVTIALLLLTVGALALAGGIASGDRARRDAVARGLALAAAEGWLETWRAAPWPEPGAGIEAIAWGPWRGEIRWRTSLLARCLAEARVEAGAPEHAPAVVLVTRRFREGVGDCGR